MKKKILIVLGIFIVMFLSVALLVPLFVDVDKYRPKIVEVANQYLNGKLELGRLSLSLWGQVRVEIGGLKVVDAHDVPVVTVKDAYFHVPLLPLLTGAPTVTLKMNHPTIQVTKSKSGQLNVTSLMKDTSKETAKDKDQQTATGTTPGGAVATAPAKPAAIPSIATKARLGVEFRSVDFSYKDVMTGLTTTVEDLNLIIRDISLSHPTELELWANLDTKMGSLFKLVGPARMKASSRAFLKEGQFDRVEMDAHLDMDSVQILVPGLFEKKAGIPMRADFNGSLSEQLIQIEKLEAVFFDAQVRTKGDVKITKTPTGLSQSAYRLNIASNEIPFKGWSDLVPLLQQYELDGTAQLTAQVSGQTTQTEKGPTQKLDYQGKLAIGGLSAKAPNLKAKPRIDGVLDFATDQVRDFTMTLKAPGNDLKFRGKVVSFAKPKIDIQVDSSGMDLDELIEFPPPAAKANAQSGTSTTTSAPAGQTQAGKSEKPAGDYDALLAPLRQNKMLADTVAVLTLNMKRLKAYNVKLTDLACKAQFKDLAFDLSNCALSVFSGRIKADATTQLKPAMPTYRFSAHVSGFDIKQAMESQLQLFKNTLIGRANFEMSGQGASLNPDSAIANLKANGKMQVANATFATIDVMKMVGEALNKSLNQVGDKVPALKGKSVSLPSHTSEYEMISSDFSIAGGRFSAPNFLAKSKPNQGIDLKGATSVGLKDYSLDTTWEVVDTHNLTKLRDVSVEQNGIRVEHILAEGSNPVRFPIHVGCTIKAPCYSYTEVPTFLAKVVLDNTGKAVAGHAKDQVRKKAEEMVEKVAPPGLKESIKEKFKGFFR